MGGCLYGCIYSNPKNGIFAASLVIAESNHMLIDRKSQAQNQKKLKYKLLLLSIDVAETTVT
jgi:hypothetical protein